MVNVTPFERDYLILDRNVVHRRANHEGWNLGRLVTGGCACGTENAAVKPVKPVEPTCIQTYELEDEEHGTFWTCCANPAPLWSSCCGPTCAKHACRSAKPRGAFVVPSSWMAL